jgi:hypothetical protein
MSDRIDHDRINIQSEELPDGFQSADVLAVLAVSAFLAAVGLTTFVLTTAIAG